MTKQTIDQTINQSITSSETEPGCCHTCKIKFLDGESIKYHNGKLHHPKCLKKTLNALAGRPHECPKCTGEGMASSKHNDSVSVKDNRSVCDICHGHGYTERKMIPVTAVTGYVEE